ncbi:MAG: NAD-glutamate dehydrogenase [Alphaproteobacteria bacterium]|nr:NAD-glutamate dehydrogenase [Alphaproteobacteria bacterium]
MTTAGQAKKEILVEKVAAETRKRAKGTGVKNAVMFAQEFYRFVPPDDIVETPPRDLAGSAFSLWSFGQKHRPGQTAVRAYAPNLKKNGWSLPFSIVEIVNDDMPFLVDSVANELTRLGLSVHLIIHPIVSVVRDAKGRIVRVVNPEDREPSASNESFMHVEIDQIVDSEMAKRIVDGIKNVLSDVSAAVEDWPRMRAEVASVLAELDASPPSLPMEELEEGKQFLRWLDDGHFTFLGYREYTFPHEKRGTRLGVVPGSGLGVLRKDEAQVFEGIRDMDHLPPEVTNFVQQPKLLLATKGNRRATVHRTVYLDAIGIKLFDSAGRVTGARLFVGLFTSAAYNRSPRYIPMLRRKINQTLEAAGLHPASHDGKAMLHILETFPRDELFQIGGQDLLDIGIGILNLQERQRTALFVRRDPFERSISCMVFVPRDRHDTNLRKRFQRILEKAFEGECIAFDTLLDQQSVLARIHFIIRTRPGHIPAYDAHQIEQRIIAAARSWNDRLRAALTKTDGEKRATELLARYSDAFGIAYQESYNVVSCVQDIKKIEEIISGGRIGLNLHRRDDQAETRVRFKIYHLIDQVPLSDALPVLENLGFKVISEQPFRIDPSDRDAVWIHDFNLVRRDGLEIDIDEIHDAFHEAFARVWTGHMESDGFNRLVVTSGLSWREVVVLRSYSKYLRQAQIPFSQEYMETTLAKNADLTRLIVDLFEARFNPAGGKAAAQKERRIAKAIAKGLDAVVNLDEDRIIRRFTNLVEVTLRTNFYQAAATGDPKTYVSFKLDSRAVDDLPLPRPMVEIFVYSPWIEGVHLRFGKVARGGLRWSDRREDFRTEILGLVKAQQVKNAVIVPVGSKGGFVVKRPPQGGDREAILKEGISCYKTFISGLLDLTDNLVGGKVVPPKDVVRKDEDDSYLVVAADKGTATFSDIANGVAGDYGFWLDDAFASGGSAGYDHKKMGITARGAWESVKRHFREAGKDIQNEDFTVVGVGDMSGDVFGNGMLLSRHIKLVAAFNHMHIFVDPNPDPAKSFKERQRMFRLPRSAWSDYDSKVLSKGGAIYARSAKSLKLTPEIKALLGMTKDNVAPNELMTAILTADVDLLWFGGIGTYVKSDSQSNADAGDRANDGIRINGKDVRAKVVGEGANLGVTQLGRIEYALAGGRINTDSVDNSAGVDCSDHEVNIKILLGAVEQANKLNRVQRDKLLVSMTDEVADLVLRDNYLQTGSLAVTEFVGTRLTDRCGLFMRALERAGHLNRAIEYLPDDEELADRKAKKLGLTSPELSILIAYAKIVLYDQLLASDFPDDPFMAIDLERYFPVPLQKKYKDAINQHRLRREIVATVATNSMINRAGITFAHEVMDQTGAASSDVARAYTISRTIFSMRDLWAAIEALDNKVPAAVQSEMHMETGRLIDRGTTWFLRYGKQPLDVAANIEAYGPGTAQLMRGLEKVTTPADHEFIRNNANALVEKGAPHGLARRIASLRLLVSACDVVMIAREAKSSIDITGSLYFAVGDHFGFDWLRRKAARLPIDSHWDKQATTAIVDDLYGHQFELTSNVLKSAKKNVTPKKAIDEWCGRRGVEYQSTLQLMDDLRQGGTIDLAMLAVANRQLRSLISS